MKIAQSENPAPQQMPEQMPQQMAQAQQLPEDVGIAQNPVPPMQMAGGGIIAFDEGGNVDVDPEDEYQDLLDKAQEDETTQEIFDLISEMGSSGNAGVGITAGRGGDKGDLVGRLRETIMAKESGGRRYDKDGNLLTSSKGALGEMQVMPGTARDPGFGIKAARNNSPEELRRVGDEYAGVLLNRYRDPKLAMIAYNMGPGATDKWLASGADINKLPRETQGYIRGVNLAQGGEVQHFAAGDYIPFGEEVPYDESQSWGLKDWFKRNSPGSKEFIKAQEEEKKKAAEAKKPTPAPVTETPVVQGPRLEGPMVEEPKAKAEEDAFNLMQYFRERQARADKQAEKDKWQAGLAAGLGMLGGTSQYWQENIGKGGQMGVQQLAQLQKLRASQDIAGDKMLGSAYNAEMLGKLRKDQLAQSKGLKEGQLNQELLTAKNAFIEKRLKALGMDEMMLGTLRRQQALGKLDSAKKQELDYYEKRMKEVENEANRLYSSPSAGNGMRIVGVR